MTGANVLIDIGGRLKTADGFAQAAIDALDDNPHAYAVRARIHLRRNELDSAAADYSAADARGRPAAYIKTALGNIALRRADLATDLEAPLHYIGAARLGAEAIVIRADYPPAWLLQAKARFGLAQLEPLFEKRAELLAEARGLFEKALDHNPDLEVRIQLGRCMVEQSSNAPPESLEPALGAKRIALLEAAQQQFLLAAVQDAKSAPAYYHLAGVQRRLALATGTRDFSAALLSYKTALDLHPNYPGALRGIGVISRDQANLQESAAQLRAALEADPNDPLTIAELAETLSLLDNSRLQEAESLVRTALARGRHRATLLSVLGAILELRGAFHEAVHAYAGALALRQQAWRAERLMGAAVKTHDPSILGLHADAVRAAIATEPYNASAQKALADFNWALAGSVQGASNRPTSRRPAASPPNNVS